MKQTFFFCYTILFREFISNNIKKQPVVIDYKCKVLISALCFIGNRPTPPTITEKKENKVVTFLIDHDLTYFGLYFGMLVVRDLLKKTKTTD